MRNIFLGIVIALVLVFALRYFEHTKDEREQLTQSTTLIQKQLENVGKLVVTEGNYAQVFSYEDSQKFYFDVLSARKKALVVVNATASIAYDLRKIRTEVNPETKTVTIVSIPPPELSINPNIEYYDVTQDYLNQFDAKDYNLIKRRVEKMLREKISNSELTSNAQNRLISELQKIYIVTESMGWTLVFKDTTIEDQNSLQQLTLPALSDLKN